MMKWIWCGIWLIYFLALAFFTVLGVSSYFVYSTAGFDFEEPTEQGAVVTYYRLRWDDGSTWIGMAVQPVPRPNRPLDWFDPGGTLMDEPTKPRHPYWFNRWGFWWITDVADDPFVFDRYGGATESYWAGVPSWLFLVVIGLPAGLWFWRIWTSSKKASRAKTDEGNKCK